MIIADINVPIICGIYMTCSECDDLGKMSYINMKYEIDSLPPKILWPFKMSKSIYVYLELLNRT